jgi:hypothetical protein
VRYIDPHADGFHSVQDRMAESGQATVTVLQKSTPNGVAVVVSQLRNPLAEGEERVHVVNCAKVDGILQSQHDADLLLSVRAIKVAGVIDTQKLVTERSQEGIPPREKRDIAREPEREDINPGIREECSIVWREAARVPKPPHDLRREFGSVGKHELIQEIHNGRLLDETDGPTGILDRRLCEKPKATT